MKSLLLFRSLLKYFSLLDHIYILVLSVIQDKTDLRITAAKLIHPLGARGEFNLLLASVFVLMVLAPISYLL